jgi:prophage regulatory protein
MVLQGSQQLQVLRLSEVVNKFGRSKTSIYLDGLKGVFPTPISLGERAKGYLEHEVMAVIAARAQGCNESQVQKLVKELIESRKHLAKSLSLPYLEVSNG